ncbi:cysteine dioxygenase family protein [bacterium]|nr:cysteine dioxygenase family protein [bacterium]
MRLAEEESLMNQKVSNLVSRLDHLSRRASLGELGQLLASENITLHDISDYYIFNDIHYQRNKVSGSEWYDLYVMCWKPGQNSAIHDHLGSSCAFKILQGMATEYLYECVDCEHNYVQQAGIQTYSPGLVCEAQDGDIHKIVNGSTIEPLVTMHLYSPPLTMNVYEPAPQKVVVNS